MSDRDARDRALQRQGRVVAIVIASAGLLAILAHRIVELTGLPANFEFLFYLASMAAFLWSFVVTYQIWRKRRSD